jgi:hypothetical protein
MRNTFLDLRTARDIDAVVTKILRGLGNPEPPPVRPEKPHGPDYSLTLHDGDGERLLGFDNAHPIREDTGPGAQASR